MSDLTKEVEVEKKRKRDSGAPSETRRVKRRVTGIESDHEADIQFEILLLENQILESRKHYNSIVTLLGYSKEHDAEDQRDIAAAVALCRVFCRLMAAGRLTKSRETADDEVIIVQWLKKQIREYEASTLVMLFSEDISRQSTALTLLMRLMREQANYLKLQDDSIWRNGIFTEILQALVGTRAADARRTEFVEKYLVKYDDIRYHTFAFFTWVCSEELSVDVRANEYSKFVSEDPSDVSLENTVSMLAEIENVPETQEQIESFFVTLPAKKHSLRSLTAHKRRAQDAWLAILGRDLSKPQRKTVLGLMSHRIAPWFLKVELLMDFLTDSFNVGGSTSLMALSGLYYLMQEKNLDYPQFYHKLYSLLDRNILHSKHRSRFFRLLDTFLASTHLPAALVASFIKRLSRLSLHAPPSGIVVVVPWVYNLLKTHPSCTFMIHRKARGEREDPDPQEEQGYGDPFRMDEPDPMETDALESSLWEIQMLQSHYHPNVATIAKIISEQFTKQAYNLEDFLDHSYGSMLDAELSKDIKKAPEVEYEIPKRIFMRYGEDEGNQDSLLVKLWDFS